MLVQPVGTFHDQGGLAITIYYFPATMVVFVACALSSVLLGRQKQGGLDVAEDSAIKMLQWVKIALVALGFLLSVGTLFIA